jgi:hypothetical protein
MGGGRGASMQRQSQIPDPQTRPSLSVLSFLTGDLTQLTYLYKSFFSIHTEFYPYQY